MVKKVGLAEAACLVLAEEAGLPGTTWRTLLVGLEELLAWVGADDFKYLNLDNPSRWVILPLLLPIPPVVMIGPIVFGLSDESVLPARFLILPSELLIN